VHLPVGTATLASELLVPIPPSKSLNGLKRMWQDTDAAQWEGEAVLK